MALVKLRTFLDTSILLGGIIEVGPSVAFAQRVMGAVAERKLSRPATAWHCCLEFYSVATRLPEEIRLLPEDAVRLLEAEVLRRLEVLELPGAERLPFLRAAAGLGVAGGRLYDAHIAEIARSSGAQALVTENPRHFATLLRHGIRVLRAEELVKEAGL